MNGVQPAFLAQAFHPSFGNEWVQGRIILDPGRLRFEAGNIRLEMPLSRLEIEVDETTADRICFTDPQLPDLTICTFDRKVFKAWPMQRQTNTRTQIRRIESRGEAGRRIKVAVACLAIFAVGAGFVTALTGLMVRSLVAQIPAKVEKDIGDKAMAEVQSFATFSTDSNLQAKLDNAVAPLLPALPKSSVQYKFYVLDEPFPNAFALPGGHVLVTAALLQMAERPEEIAGTVAHEIAHVTQKHGFRKIIAAAGPYLIFKVFLGGGGGLLGFLGSSSELLVNQSFSQEYELEADSVGWDYLVAAHIDPRGLADMLRKLEVEQQRALRFEPAFHAFSSHPATEKRLQRLDAKWKKLKNKDSFVPILPAEAPNPPNPA